MDLENYCLNFDLHKSMFFIDMLEDTYEFTLKGDEVEIFKKLKSGISEPITRKELIYSIQVEMVEKYEYYYIKEKGFSCMLKKEQLISTFYNLFETVDSIHKAIDNMVYLEKYLNKKEESTDEEESDEESSGEEEQVGPQKTLEEERVREGKLEELKIETLRILKKQKQGQQRQMNGDY